MGPNPNGVRMVMPASEVARGKIRLRELKIHDEKRSTQIATTKTASNPKNVGSRNRAKAIKARGTRRKITCQK